MKTKPQDRNNGNLATKPVSMSERGLNGRIFSTSDPSKLLDTMQLHQLEQSFRDWVEAALRPDVRLSRQRILLVFLLIRYTAAKLSEVLGLDPGVSIDLEKHFVMLRRGKGRSDRSARKVQMSAVLCHEIQAIISDPRLQDQARNMLAIDPGFVRRKFYERAEACGIARHMGAPEILRKSRAVELMQNNMPLPAVQMLLGHSTPNLTSAYVSFSQSDIEHVTRLFIEKEADRKTSARNSFFGKIQRIQKGDIQARVELMTLGGNRIMTIVTNDSMQRLGLAVGKLITAEVKAPWVMLHKNTQDQECSADNILDGLVDRITEGRINTECIVRLADGTEICALITTESSRRLSLSKGDRVWALFNSFAVILLSD
jgi:molybdate transport system regulatory protein